MHGQFRTVEGGTVLKVDESCSRRDAEERIVIRAVSGKECEVRAEYMKVVPDSRVRNGVSDDTMN